MQNLWWDANHLATDVVQFKWLTQEGHAGRPPDQFSNENRFHGERSDPILLCASVSTCPALPSYAGTPPPGCCTARIVAWTAR